MPTLSISRTFEAPYRKWEASAPRPLRDSARREIAKRIESTVGFPGVDLRCSVDEPTAARLTISTSVQAEDLRRLHQRCLEIGAKQLDDAYGTVDRSVVDLVEVLSYEEQERREHDGTEPQRFAELATYVAGFVDHAYPSQANSIFGTGRAAVVRSCVVFTVSRDTARRLRKPEDARRFAVDAYREHHLGGVIAEVPYDFTVVTDCRRRTLTVTCRNDRAEHLAEALLGRVAKSTTRPQRTSESLAWAVGSLAAVLVTLVAAPFDASSRALPLYGIAISAIIATTVWFGAAKTGRFFRTALGMSPTIVVGGFTVVYALMMRGRDAQIRGVDDAELVDAMLLSLGVASTNGVVSFDLHGAGARWAVLLEMLLVASVLGATLMLAVREVIRRLNPSLGDDLPEGD